MTTTYTYLLVYTNNTVANFGAPSRYSALTRTSSLALLQRPVQITRKLIYNLLSISVGPAFKCNRKLGHPNRSSNIINNTLNNT